MTDYERGFAAGVEAAACEVLKGVGSFQDFSGPVRQVDGALRAVASDIRALRAPAPLAAEMGAMGMLAHDPSCRCITHGGLTCTCPPLPAEDVGRAAHEGAKP